MPDSPFPAIIPKERAPALGRVVRAGSTWVFSGALVLFIAALVLAGGLYFYGRALQTTRGRWVEQVKAQEAELRPELLSQLTQLGATFASVRDLLSSHSFPSNVLTLVQSLTHPSVQFTGFSYSRSARKIELAGLARSYQTVAQQVRAMEASPQIERVDFGGLSRNERGLVNFKLAVIFKASVLVITSR